MKTSHYYLSVCVITVTFFGLLVFFAQRADVALDDQNTPRPMMRASQDAGLMEALDRNRRAGNPDTAQAHANLRGNRAQSNDGREMLQP